MAIKRFDICVWRKYDKDGEEKKQYTKIGTLVEFSATEDKPRGFKVELPIFGHEKFSVFEQKPREEGTYKGQNAPNSNGNAKDEIDTIQADETQPGPDLPAESIPF